MQPAAPCFVAYNGDGATVNRTFTFNVDALVRTTCTELVCTRITLDSSGLPTSIVTLVEGVDYTVLLNPKVNPDDLAWPGGTVTYTTAATLSPVQIDYIQRSTPLAQSEVYPNSGPFDLRSIEAGLDLLTRICQEQALVISRCNPPANPDSVNTVWPEVVPDNYGQYATIDNAGNPVFTDLPLSLGTITLVGNVATRLCVFGGTDELDGLANALYTVATKTLTLIGSSTGTDKTQVWKNSGGAEVASIRSDGSVATNTSLATKLYVDTQVAGLGVLGTVIAGFVSGAGVVADTDTILQAIDKLDGNEVALAATVAALPAPLKNVSRGACSNSPLASSTAETTLVQFSVPGNTLSTNRRLRGKMFISSFSTTASPTCTFRVKYGSTTMATVVVNAKNASGAVAELTFDLFGTGVNTQRAFALIDIWNVTNEGSAVYQATGTASETQSGALNLTITAQWSASSASNTLTAPYYSADVDT